MVLMASDLFQSTKSSINGVLYVPGHCRRIPKPEIKSNVTVPESSNVPFRFFDLPGEIREQIYTELLTCRMNIVHEAARGTIRKSSRVKHNISAAFLRTSRQVYHEVYPVLCKSNLFVRIDIRHKAIEARSAFRCLPIVAFNDAARRCKAAAFRVVHKSQEDQAIPCKTYLILAQHLPLLTELISQTSILCRTNMHDSSTELRLLHDRSIRKDRQALVLSSFQAHQKGIANLTVTGMWDIKLAALTPSPYDINAQPDAANIVEQLGRFHDEALRYSKMFRTRNTWLEYKHSVAAISILRSITQDETQAIFDGGGPLAKRFAELRVFIALHSAALHWKLWSFHWSRNIMGIAQRSNIPEIIRERHEKAMKLTKHGDVLVYELSDEQRREMAVTEAGLAAMVEEFPALGARGATPSNQKRPDSNTKATGRKKWQRFPLGDSVESS